MKTILTMHNLNQNIYIYNFGEFVNSPQLRLYNRKRAGISATIIHLNKILVRVDT